MQFNHLHERIGKETSAYIASHLNGNYCQNGVLFYLLSHTFLYDCVHWIMLRLSLKLVVYRLSHQLPGHERFARTINYCILLLYDYFTPLSTTGPLFRLTKNVYGFGSQN